MILKCLAQGHFNPNCSLGAVSRTHYRAGIGCSLLPPSVGSLEYKHVFYCTIGLNTEEYIVCVKCGGKILKEVNFFYVAVNTVSIKS